MGYDRDDIRLVLDCCRFGIVDLSTLGLGCYFWCGIILAWCCCLFDGGDLCSAGYGGGGVEEYSGERVVEGLVRREEAGGGLRSLVINVGEPSIPMDMGAARASVEPVARKGGHMEKFMLSLREDSMRIVLLEAERRGVSVQELIRAVIIPEWIRENIRKE